ncbi:MAG: DNA ligase D [Gammaproteobacteria bacterium]|nr:DNA ligase D [Gammaproteobacteria bacterium]
MSNTVKRSLTTYRRKRNFEVTAEPKGDTLPSQGQRYVMHKHKASHLHYDLRLEEGGVLRSWALPKGPSLKRGEKRLAVEVEDHPIDYGTFEGTIPKGQYGGGTIMLWDEGTWEVTGKSNGDRIDFTLDGGKLKGAWTLVRSGVASGRPATNWLLIKRGTNDVSAADAHDLSILSGRTMDEIAKALPFDQTETMSSDFIPLSPSNIPGARPQSLPASYAPQLATAAEVAPEGDEWVHEIKFDGYRMIVHIAGGKIRLLTRNGLNWTGRFAAQVQQLEALKVKDAILDGEMVAMDKDGISSFAELQDLVSAKNTGSLVLHLFDLMYLDGYDLTAATLLDRKAALKTLLQQSDLAVPGSLIQYSDHVIGLGREFFEHACELGLEGTVAKLANAQYSSRRSNAWLKIKDSQDGEFVVGGFTPPSGLRKGFGALLLGSWEGNALRYRGRVGTGFSDKQLKHLLGVLTKAKRQTSPFADNVPDAKGVTWATPQLVVDVEFSDETREGRLRHPIFRGVREDRNAKEVVMGAATAHVANKASDVRVSPKRVSSTSTRGDDVVEGIRITHPDRVVYPDIGLTKIEVAQFYADIQDWLMPMIANRLLSLVRCPDGREQECFFQKHLLASQASRVPRQDFRQSKGAKPYAYVQSIKHVIALVQSGVLEFHPFGSLITDTEHPDQMIFDLDPSPGVQWEDILKVTRELRERLEKLGFNAFVRTTGGKGLHVVVPLRPTTDWDGVKAFAKAVSEQHAADAPSQLTTKLPKAQRQHKIFIDYLRNGRGATAVASYSTRARSGAPVAVPIRWDELTSSLRPDQYSVTNLRRRLAHLKEDPWADFYDSQVAITPRMRKAVGL